MGPLLALAKVGARAFGWIPKLLKGPAISDAQHLANITTHGAEEAVRIANRGFFGRALDSVKSMWKGTPKGVRTTAKIGAGVYAGKEGVEYAAEQALEKVPGVDLIKNAKQYLPWLLGAAAVGGVFLAFKDRVFGTSEEPTEARQPAPAMQPAPAIALTPEEQLLVPQMSAPMALGSTVTASYPAAVATPTGAVVRSAERPETTYASGRPRPERAGNTPAPQVAQEAPKGNNWQARVGGQKAPVESYAARETVADTHLAEQQSRADAAALQQNGVA